MISSHVSSVFRRRPEPFEVSFDWLTRRCQIGTGTAIIFRGDHPDTRTSRCLAKPLLKFLAIRRPSPAWGGMTTGVRAVDLENYYLFDPVYFRLHCTCHPSLLSRTGSDLAIATMT